MKAKNTENLVRGILLMAVLGIAGCSAQTDRAPAPDEARSDDVGGRAATDTQPEVPPHDTAAPTALDADGPAILARDPLTIDRMDRRLAPMGSGQPTAIAPKSLPIEADTFATREPLEAAAPAIAPQTAVKRMAAPPVDAIPLTAGDVAADEPGPIATAPPPGFDATGVPLDLATAPTVAAPIALPGDFTLVKVFYGTDREAITDAELHPLGKIPWEWFTVAAGSLTVLLVLVRFVAKRSAVLSLALGVSLVATFVLGVCMYRIPRNTKPDTADTSLRYGGGRGKELQMGVCEVSIPKTHKIGQLESPSILSLEFNEDPEKHVVLMGVERREPDAFFDELNQRVNESPTKEAFVFIHGYNVTFEKAARRTAQLAYDLRFEGAPIFYSWPSVANPLQYSVDENNAVWTVPQLREFLLGIARRTEARRIHLIAHSMGNRALTAALARLSMEVKQEELPLFHEVLLTAPDIDADVFRRDIAPAIVKTAQRVTLYASSNDNALIASKKVHGYPRAGESGANIVVLAGIDTIDVSGVDTSLLGHSYYGSSDSVLTDMAQLLHEYKPPDLRDRLKAVPLGTLRYWQFLAEKMGLSSKAD
jgi:esterase/lipase superfamily enzyme